MAYVLLAGRVASLAVHAPSGGIGADPHRHALYARNQWRRQFQPPGDIGALSQVKREASAPLAVVRRRDGDGKLALGAGKFATQAQTRRLGLEIEQRQLVGLRRGGRG